MTRDWADLHRRLAQDEPGLKILKAAARGASWLYGLGSRLNALSFDLGWREVRRLSVPVIGVGNLAAGGSGKTPLTALIVQTLGEMGRRPGIISRGYGGRREEDPLLVSRGGEVLAGADRAGDEPVMLARETGAPVAVGADRAAAGELMIREAGVDVLVGDDLYQHRRLFRDLNILALDAAAPLGNGALLPRGVLREGPWALARADALVLTRAGDEKTAQAARLCLLPRSGEVPVLYARHSIRGLSYAGERESPPAPGPGEKVSGFCGLARPWDFRRSLEDYGLNVVDFRSFPDHHAFTAGDVAGLWERAGELELPLITSAKDRARLKDFPPEPGLWVTRLEMEIWGGDALLKNILQKALDGRRAV